MSVEVDCSLLPKPLSIVVPRECVFCPGVVHRGSSGPSHMEKEATYDIECAKWMKSAESTTPIVPGAVSPDETFVLLTKSFEQGWKLATSPRTAIVTCGLIGISLTSYFNEAHLVETLTYISQRCDKVRIVIIADPYLSSQTHRALVKNNAWGVGMPPLEALSTLKNPEALRRATEKLIMQKLRIVRRWVYKVYNVDLSAAATDVPLTNGPRFAWIQWADVVALPLYQKMRKSIANTYKTNPEFKKQVMSIAHHPVHSPTAAQTTLHQTSDSFLSPYEEELFTDYFLSEHAFLACLPTWLECTGEAILLPYHCNSRALPFIMSQEHFCPTNLELVHASYCHSSIGLLVLPTQSSKQRANMLHSDLVS